MLGWVDFPFVMIESHVGMFFLVVLAWKADFFLFVVLFLKNHLFDSTLSSFLLRITSKCTTVYLI